VAVVRVEFDETVSRLAGGATGLDAVTAATVHAALIQIARTYPRIHLFNCDGDLRGILRVYRNGQPVASVRTEPLDDGDVLRLAVT